MKIYCFSFFLIVFFISCNKENSVELRFVDEYVVKDSLDFKNTLVGGLSGIDYSNGSYYLVIDDEDTPRILEASIDVQKDKITNVNFLEVVHLNDTNSFIKNNILDLESVFVDENNHLNLVSEGDIKTGKDPVVFSVNKQGDFIGCYALPEYFKANSKLKPRHNSVFESSCKSFDKKGFWVGMEGVLEADGNAPSELEENYPIRITYYNNATKDATSQFVYLLDPILRPAKGKVNVNGMTGMVEYEKNKFFLVERSFQSGYGTKGNSIRIYKVDLSEEATNTLSLKSLKEEKYSPVKKELVFNFDSVRSQLTGGVIDNIEGITFGPKLSNGNQSLILVSDDNFQKHAKQLNQFVLLEIH